MRADGIGEVVSSEHEMSALFLAVVRPYDPWRAQSGDGQPAARVSLHMEEETLK